MWTREDKYILSAGSPPGSNEDISELGIVMGHAYSILDACEVDGDKLIQLRNPWGGKSKWQGAWGDKSPQWTERATMIITRRMMLRDLEKYNVG